MGEEWFEQWFEAYQIDPWGPERDDWRLQMHAAVSGVPGDVDNLKYPSSFEQLNKIREALGEGEVTQQPIGVALEVLKGVIGGRRPGN